MTSIREKFEQSQARQPKFKKIYVAGPMQGAPEHGYPVFDQAVNFLRHELAMRDGFLWEVFSPHEVDNGETPESRGTKDHWDYMKVDMRLLVYCDAICLLDGWSRSRGAVQELNCAIAMGLDVWRYQHRENRFYKIS